MADGTIDAATLKALAKAGGFAVAAAEVADPSRYGALAVSGRKVTGIQEKSKRAKSKLVNTGFYRVPLAAMQECAHLKPSPRGELEFTDVLAAWAKKGKVHWVKALGWRDVGTPWDLLAAHEAMIGPWMDFLLDGETVGGTGMVEDGVHVRGRLFVEAGATVKAGTYIEGDVFVGPARGSARTPICAARSPWAAAAMSARRRN